MRLQDYLVENSISDAAFAVLIGVSRQAVHRYKTGDRIPEWPVMAVIKEKTGGAVTADDFAPTSQEVQRAAS